MTVPVAPSQWSHMTPQRSQGRNPTPLARAVMGSSVSALGQIYVVSSDHQLRKFVSDTLLRQDPTWEMLLETGHTAP